MHRSAMQSICVPRYPAEFAPYHKTRGAEFAPYLLTRFLRQVENKMTLGFFERSGTKSTSICPKMPHTERFPAYGYINTLCYCLFRVWLMLYEHPYRSVCVNVVYAK